MTKVDRLPYGCGSVQKRGRVYWMIYPGEGGQILQENTRTEDGRAALRILALRTLPQLRAKVAALQAKLATVEAVANESESQGRVHNRQPVDGGGGRRAGSGSVRP